VLPRLDKIRYEEAEADLRRHYEATESRDLGEYTYRVAHLTRFFAGRCIATLGKPDITAYIAARRQETARPRTRVAARVASGTIRKELTLLGTMLRLAYENKKLLHLPVIHKPEEGPARAGFFEPEQFDAVRRRLRPDLQVVVTIGHTYGWRKGEVLGLERRHVDLDAGTLRLDPGTTKNGEGRVVYLTPEAKHLLAEQLARVDALQKPLQRIIPFVFPHLSGRHRGQRIGGFQTAWENACKKAGVAGRLVHDLRRTAVRNMERNGVARSVATKMTGHKTESVYRRYAIVSDADLREAARKLTGAFSGRVGQISEKPVAEQVRI
jgi:integrase